MEPLESIDTGATANSLIAESTQLYAGESVRQLSCLGSGPTIVLLHGAYDRAETWQGVIVELAAAGRQAVAVDLPPFRGADGVARRPLLPSLDAVVAAIVRHHAGADGVVLVGNSMGAGLTLRAALDSGLPIRATVTLNLPGFGYTPLVASTTGPYSPSIAILGLLPPALLRPELLRWVGARGLYAVPRNADPKILEHFVAQARARAGLGTMLADGRALLREFVTYPPGGPTVPLLIAHGRHDRLIPVSAAARAHRRYPGSEVLIWDDCGHSPQLENPAAVAAAITDFESRARSVA